MKITPIETNRLIIREVEESDVSNIHEYASDETVTRYMLWGPNNLNKTKEVVQKFICYQKQNERKDFELVAILKKTNKLIGGCGLRLRKGHIELGYIFNKTYWGNGFATELAMALVEYIEKHYPGIKIQATCDSGNLASKRVLEKAGLKLINEIKNECKVRGEWRNTLFFELEPIPKLD